MMQLLRFGFIALVLIMAGCATCRSVETDPTKTSTAGVLFCGNELEQHLEKRRSYLGDLNSRLSILDDELLSTQAALFKLKNELKVVAIPAMELKKIQQDIQAMENEQNALENTIIQQKELVKELEYSVKQSQGENKLLDEQLAEARRKAENMEKKLAIVKTGIKRTASLKLKYSQ